MYLHEDSRSHITLHDCQANRAVLADGMLTLFFPDGFGVMPGHPEHAAGEEVLRTDAAEVRIPLVRPEDWKTEIDMFVFSHEKENGQCTRKHWKAKKLLEKINDACRMEVLSLYVSHDSTLLKGYLWYDERPYSREFELEVHSREPVFCWNELTGECV